MAEKTPKEKTVRELAARMAKALEARTPEEQRRTLDAVGAMLGIESRAPKDE